MIKNIHAEYLCVCGCLDGNRCLLGSVRLVKSKAQPTMQMLNCFCGMLARRWTMTLTSPWTALLSPKCGTFATGKRIII
eukprot:COSAG02_NODE_5409_length_4352_cov_3.033153_4_plen_79_part_00